jgi:hypothetical protein
LVLSSPMLMMNGHTNLKLWAVFCSEKKIHEGNLRKGE